MDQGRAGHLPSLRTAPNDGEGSQEVHAGDHHVHRQKGGRGGALLELPEPREVLRQRSRQWNVRTVAAMRTSLTVGLAPTVRIFATPGPSLPRDANSTDFAATSWRTSTAAADLRETVHIGQVPNPFLVLTR